MALGKKVKTLYLSFEEDRAAAYSQWDNGVDSHTFQDNIRVIGCQVGSNTVVNDTASNTDQEYDQIVEVSKHGIAGHDGALARWASGLTWNGIIAIGGDVSGGSAPLVFPDGHGVDFDDGEAIYLHSFVRNVGSVTLTSAGWAIVYYVER